MREGGPEDGLSAARGCFIIQESSGIRWAKVEENLGPDLLEFIFGGHSQERGERGEIGGLMPVGEPAIRKITISMVQSRDG